MPSSPTDGVPATSRAGERAAQLYREGNRFYDEGRFVEAEARYQAAWDLQQSFDVAGNLGNVELEVNQPREAAEHLVYALDTFPLGEKLEKRSFLQKRLAEAKSQVGTLRISVNVDDAEVLIDGKLIGHSPLDAQVFVDPGKRTLEARRAGARTSTSLFVARGSDQRIALSLDTGPNIPLVVAGGAVGLLGVASGVTFAILSTAKARSADGEPSGSPRRLDLRDSQSTLANISFWSFLGGGVVLAGTAAYALTTSSRTSSPSTGLARLHAAPLVTSDAKGLLLGASF
ncbi:hypothetical protein [Sorangium cellulosum]|uniref:PEGA domain-containing protein n=1 Tax=Sorangium cellulosum TaxID=56 RepID=A0A150QEB4_SORCE|nr:hypothetical protein [Sorangium cellulosum]KYF66334.1 hypothetical protein BE15_01675 [Sorangium cellulosum]